VAVVPKTKGKAPVREGRQPTLARYADRRHRIRFSYKGKRYSGQIRPDGKIRFLGKLFNSPSLAATEVTKRPMNGWTAWSYERVPDDWILLNELGKNGLPGSA
jgi:hypothetical protein